MIKVFVSYSHEDKTWVEKLRTHLRPFQCQIDLWDDTRIKPGKDWAKEIDSALAEADVAVLLVSSHFLDSVFITSIELPRLLDAAKQRGCILLPLIVDHCMVELHRDLSKIQAVNPLDRPLRYMRPAQSHKILKDVALAVLSRQVDPRAQPLADMKEPEAEQTLALVRQAVDRAQPNSTDYFEVDRYEVLLAVEPLPEKHEATVSFGIGQMRTRSIKATNRARVRKTVTFKENRCTDLFELNYRTLSDGCIAIRNRDTVLRYNEALQRDLDRYSENGDDLTFQFTPKVSTYSLDLDVYGGYGDGNRDIACYLPRRAHCRQFCFTLDLTSYLSKGYRLAVGPDLFFFEHGSDGWKNPLQATPDLAVTYSKVLATGVWDWCVADKIGGVAFVRWDFALPRPSEQG